MQNFLSVTSTLEQQAMQVLGLLNIKEFDSSTYKFQTIFQLKEKDHCFVFRMKNYLCHVVSTETHTWPLHSPPISLSHQLVVSDSLCKVCAAVMLTHLCTSDSCCRINSAVFFFMPNMRQGHRHFILDPTIFATTLSGTVKVMHGVKAKRIYRCIDSNQNIIQLGMFGYSQGRVSIG